jgi:hypothetical protein
MERLRGVPSLPSSVKSSMAVVLKVVNNNPKEVQHVVVGLPSIEGDSQFGLGIGDRLHDCRFVTLVLSH